MEIGIIYVPARLALSSQRKTGTPTIKVLIFFFFFLINLLVTSFVQAKG